MRKQMQVIRKVSYADDSIEARKKPVLHQQQGGPSYYTQHDPPEVRESRQLYQDAHV